jgi:hypothetical protein
MGAKDDFTENLSYSTVRIDTIRNDNKGGSGTGFIYSFKLKEGDVPVLVTNKHVIENVSNCKIVFVSMDENENPVDDKHLEVELDEDFMTSWIMHPESGIDLCCIVLGPILNHFKNQGSIPYISMIRADMRPNNEELSNIKAIEEVIMIGYPRGLFDQVNNKPIIRRGITATHPLKNYNGKEDFLIDIAAFKGSSGSPVLILNQNGYHHNGEYEIGGTRLIFLGVLYSGPMFDFEGKIVFSENLNEVYTESKLPINLGCVMRASNLDELEEVVRKEYIEKLRPNG